MIGKAKVLAIIPARGGSKGLARKNIRMLGGKPLLAWTIEAAKKSRYIDRVILSSEDAEIIETARKYNCEIPFVRPAELALDDTPGIAPVLHAIDQIAGFDLIVLLQPTSPLRNAADIDACIEQCVQSAAKSCVSVTESEKSPYWMYTLGNSDEMVPLLKTDIHRRQDLPKVYALNGAVYVSSTEKIRESKQLLTTETKAYVMPRERSIDIDSELDFLFCEAVLKRDS